MGELFDKNKTISIIDISEKRLQVKGSILKTFDGTWINSLDIRLNFPGNIEGSMSGFHEYNETFETEKDCILSLISDIQVYFRNRKKFANEPEIKRLHTKLEELEKDYPMKEKRDLIQEAKELRDEPLLCVSCDNELKKTDDILCLACTENKNKFQLQDYEKVITEGLSSFLTVGNALSEIRNKKLYIYTHKTFEDYCKDKWQLTSRHARNLINEAKVIKSLQESPEPVFIPEIESEARPLTKLEPELALEVAKELEKKKSNGIDITAHVVEEEVKQKGELNKALKEVKKQPLLHQNEPLLTVAERIAKEKKESKERHPNAVIQEEKAESFTAPEKNKSEKKDPELDKTIFSTESIPEAELLEVIETFTDWSSLARGQLEIIYRQIRNFYLSKEVIHEFKRVKIEFSKGWFL